MFIKKLLSILLIISVLLSCRDNQKDVREPAEDNARLQPTTNADSALKTDRHYYWTATFAGKKGWLMTKSDPVNTDSLNVHAMIGWLNIIYPEIQLRYAKTSGDTLFLTIPDSRYLSRQMGSSGSEAYLGEATYNLTEVPGINVVALSFKKGDHAESGFYSRTDFVYSR